LSKLVKGVLPAREDDGSIKNPLDKVDKEMWYLMLRCWSTEPELRPTCQQLRTLLEAMVGFEQDKYGTDEHSSYVNQDLQDAMDDAAAVDFDLVFRVLEKVSDLRLK
jgi:hypothetical protein